MKRVFRRAFRLGGAPRVRRANELLEQGDYAGAASAFEELAAGAGRRTPMLLIQAGRARILAGQIPQGMERLKEGIQSYATRGGHWRRVLRIGERLASELRTKGMESEAEELLDLLRKKMPVIPPRSDQTEPSERSRPRPLLPTHCPSCGAPVHAGEVEWTDNNTAECDFCGNPLRALGSGNS
jgi:hypothetical protein